MKTLVVSVKDKVELKLVSDLLKKMHVEAKLLTEEQREKLGLIRLMNQANRSQKVPREKIMAKLRN